MIFIAHLYIPLIRMYQKFLVISTFLFLLKNHPPVALPFITKIQVLHLLVIWVYPHICMCIIYTLSILLLKL